MGRNALLVVAACGHHHPDTHDGVQPLHVPAHRAGELSRRRRRRSGRGAGAGGCRIQPAVAAALVLSLDDLLGADAEDLPARIRPRVHRLHLLRSARRGSVMRLARRGAGTARRSGRELQLPRTAQGESGARVAAKRGRKHRQHPAPAHHAARRSGLAASHRHGFGLVLADGCAGAQVEAVPLLRRARRQSRRSAI